MRAKRRHWGALAVSVAILATTTLASAGPAQAYCASPAVEWPGGQLHLRTSTGITSTWNSQLSPAAAQWNNISGAAWHLSYYATDFVGPIPAPLIDIRLMSSAPPGYGGAPGVTNLVLSGSTVVDGDTYFNSAYTWNSTGTMNQSTLKADRRTVAIHEFGHQIYLNHPNSCGTPLTSAETSAAMNPNWTQKWVTNSDDKAGAAARK